MKVQTQPDVRLFVVAVLMYAPRLAASCLPCNSRTPTLEDSGIGASRFWNWQHPTPYRAPAFPRRLSGMRCIGHEHGGPKCRKTMGTWLNGNGIGHVCSLCWCGSGSQRPDRYCNCSGRVSRMWRPIPIRRAGEYKSEGRRFAVDLGPQQPRSSIYRLSSLQHGIFIDQIRLCDKG